VTHAIADFSPPPLSRYAPQAIILAIAAHVLVLTLVLMTPSPEGGGGGRVLGRLNVNLGAGGTSGQTLQKIIEETTASAKPPAPTPVQPEPARTRAPVPEKMEAVRPQPTPRASRPAPAAPPVTVPVPAPETPRTDNRQADSTTSSSDTAPGSMDAGTSSVGEGAPAATIGLGATDDVAGDAHDAYLAIVRSRIEAYRTYPAAARRRQAEGTVDVYIEISETGELTFLEITSRSGSAHLDRAARRMAERAGPFPRPPVPLFTTTIPINFSLL